MPSLRGLAGKFVLAALAVAAMVGAVALRLRMVSRPGFFRVATYAAGRVERGEVKIGDRRLGESVVCAGRERAARIGATGFRAVTEDPRGSYVLVVDAARVVVLRARDCARHVRLARAEAWSMGPTALTLTVGGKPERLEYAGLAWEHGD